MVVMHHMLLVLREMEEEREARIRSMFSFLDATGQGHLDHAQIEVGLTGSNRIYVQSIEHPCYIWDAKFLENGDVVTACSDGILRIWTTNNNRFCGDEELAAYTDLISQYTLRRKIVGGLKLTNLPGLEVLQLPGNSKGHTLLVREGDNGVAYSWNSNEQKWDKIADVVDGPEDAAQNQVHDGARYDFVFNVDIGDGEPIWKLPYNRSGLH